MFSNQNDKSNGLCFVSKKNHLSHTRHVKIDLSKMKGGIFGPCQIWFFLPKFPIWKTKNSSSAFDKCNCLLLSKTQNPTINRL
jgi:hypothetical protein